MKVEGDRPGSPYLAPEVLTTSTADGGNARRKLGPVVGIMKVRDDEEAITLMNDSPYGLTASIWTRDTDRAAEIGGRVKTGTVYMNRCDYLDPQLTWTGVKDTGRGAALSRYGFDALTQPKSFHLPRRLIAFIPEPDMTAPTANWSYPTAVRFGPGRIRGARRCLPNRRYLPAAAGHRRDPRQASHHAEDHRSIEGSRNSRWRCSQMYSRTQWIRIFEAGIAAFRSGGHDGVVAFGGG